MDVVYERGSREAPKGHGLIYFRSSSDYDEVWVTYAVILPISVDVSKYVPPFLMNQLGDVGPKEMSAFAFPPAPEKLSGYGQIESLADTRDDDVLYGGTINPTDVASAMMAISDAVQQYAEAYSTVAGGVAQESPDVLEGSSDAQVSEVLYGLMSDTDKLGELTKLVGRLRFAIESSEGQMIRETEEDIGALAKHLSDTHQIPRLVEAAKSSGSHGAALADLYLKRSYGLVQESYGQLDCIEEQIRVLEEGE